MSAAIPRIDIHTTRARNAVNALFRHMQPGSPMMMDLMEDVGDTGALYMAEEVPVHSGTLKRNIFWRPVGTRGMKISTWGFNKKGKNYAPIIDRWNRTAKSRGRYVRAIDARLVDGPNIGWHPGARGTPFSFRTRERLIPYAVRRTVEAIEKAAEGIQ